MPRQEQISADELDALKKRLAQAEGRLQEIDSKKASRQARSRAKRLAMYDVVRAHPKEYQEAFAKRSRGI